jgi:hypothetical protein
VKFKKGIIIALHLSVSSIHCKKKYFPPYRAQSGRTNLPLGTFYSIMNGSEHITIDLPAAEAAFVRSFAEQTKMKLDDVFGYLVRTLHHATDRDIDPMIRSWAGILPPDSDVDALRMQYLTEKFLQHGRND